MLKNFVVDICGSKQEWSAASFVDSTVAELKEQLGNDRVILGLSGGVDSSVAAVLLNRAIGDRLTCIFVDHGMLRKNEFQQVMDDYKVLGLNVIGVDASEQFFADLAGVTDPEQKRKIIGRDFVEVFNAEAKKITDAKWLGQGTIYPDRIESLNITGKVIKSHHNVGGLPEEMHLQLCEPLKWLFKDEVRRVGRQLGMPEHLITRHPFPGPGLAVRILGDITREKVRILQDADDIFIQGLRDWGLYDQVWQAGGHQQRCHDCRLGPPALRLPGPRLQRHHQQGAWRQPRLLRHLVKATSNHRVGIVARKHHPRSFTSRKRG